MRLYPFSKSDLVINNKLSDTIWTFYLMQVLYHPQTILRDYVVFMIRSSHMYGD